MEIFGDFHCFGWMRSRGRSCSRNFTQVNMLSVRRELDFSNRDSDSWWCPRTP